MKKFVGVVLVAGLAVLALVVGPMVATAQRGAGGRPGAAAGQARRGGQPGDQPGGRPQFDPERIRTMMMERLKETLGATDDEWKVIEPLARNVMEKQTAARVGGFGGFGSFLAGRRGGPPGPGGERPSAEAPPERPGAPPGGERPRFGTPDPESEALRAALEAKDTSAKDIEAKLKALREARQKREEELKKAREELCKVLTIRQEAQLVLTGLLD